MIIDDTAVVSKGASVGEFCNIGPFVAIRAGAVIGEHTKIEAHCLIEGGVQVGEHCVVEAQSVLRKGVALRDHVRWGSGARAVLGEGTEIRVCEGALVGTSAILIAQSGSLIIGKEAIVEPGAVVTENVPPGVTVSRPGEVLTETEA